MNPHVPERFPDPAGMGQFIARLASEAGAGDGVAAKPERRQPRPPAKPRPLRRDDFAAAIARAEFAEARRRRARRSIAKTRDNI
jgi:hypothetical protein